jgi:tripartite-type tricarboxylate transporter receptor subunit TctC
MTREELKMTGRLTARILACVFTLGLSGFGAANAQEFPTKPITLIVPSSAGGSHDLTARALASVAEKYLGQPLIVELKPGGSGAVGSSLVANAKPDGYTLLFGGPDFNTTPPIMEGRPDFGPEGFVSVCRVNYTPMFLAARAGAPFKTFPELIAWAKTNPGQLKVAGARSTSSALFLKFVGKTTGIDFRPIPFEGGGATLMALLNNSADVTSGVPAAMAPHEKSGKIVFTVTTSKERHKDYPDLPTAKELGFDYEYVFWRSVLAPKGTPRPIVEKLAGMFKKMSEDPDFLKVVGAWGDKANYLGPDEFAAWWREEYRVQAALLN